ncbi:glycolate oxidase subunit GlcF [Novipirellula artificiosorum]|uniref:Glycolate oxidase iron-sulfur subunit n=1 Tax=Novipirellula artificiosorum TaxID=2528016 RepID=A0A5C6D967_9BACT|nr:glycolate oxidase subunit GlcF [Novipirellula artificiosorum]TWU33693.1 Lactate utilization protein A [Novipirellula artificiosorum]
MQHRIPAGKHGPISDEMTAAVSTCVHCGFCLAACPTYEQLGQEPDSPRGRIVLMKEVLEGELSIADASDHLDRCLGCLACEPACPSGVLYRNLISPFRSCVEPERKRTWIERLSRAMTQATLPYPTRFRIAANLGRLARPLAPMMPTSIASMLRLLPKRLPKRQSWAAVTPALGKRTARVALLTGCAQSVLDPDINTATIDVLTRSGIEVCIPHGQGCCGALSWHVGNGPQAQRFARVNLEAFPEGVDAIVTNAAGCGSGMKEYPLILKGTQYEELARSFSAKVMDVSVALTKLGRVPPFPQQRLPVRIAYHDACHLSNAQGVVEEPRELLRRIPGVEVLEIPEGHSCCGSAGTYNVDQPEIAAALGDQKVSHAMSVHPDLIATGNIGCLTQLSKHLEQRGGSIPVRHTIQVLRDAYLDRPLRSP